LTRRIHLGVTKINGTQKAPLFDDNLSATIR
jgi:hypothetical protein